MSGWFAKLGAVLDSVDNTATAQVGKLKHAPSSSAPTSVASSGSSRYSNTGDHDGDHGHDNHGAHNDTNDDHYPSVTTSSNNRVSATSLSFDAHSPSNTSSSSTLSPRVVRPSSSPISSLPSLRAPLSSPSDDDLMKLLNSPAPSSLSSSSSSSSLSVSSPPSSRVSSTTNINMTPQSQSNTPNSSASLSTPLLISSLPSSTASSVTSSVSSVASVSISALDAAFDDILGPSTPIASSSSSSSLSSSSSSSSLSLDDLPLGTSSTIAATAAATVATPSISTPLPSVPLPPSSQLVISPSLPLPLPSSSTSSNDGMIDVSSEVAGLRAVWQQSREALSRTKQLLLSKEEQWKKSTRERDAVHQRSIDDIKELHDKEISKMKKTIVQNQQEFEEALAAKTNFTRSQDRVMEDAKEKLVLHHHEINELTQRIVALESERDDMARMQQESLDAHSRALKSLRDAQVRSEQELAEEKNKNRSTLGSIISRESSLEADNAENVNALAAAHRMMEDKSKELQRVLGEKRWIEADQQALQDQVASLRQRMDADQKQSSSIIATLRAQTKSATTKTEELQDKLTAADAKMNDDSHRMRELERRLAAEDDNPLQARIKELEYKLAAMGDNVFSKNAQLERVSSERSALRLQLETETNRIQTLEKRMKELYEQRQTDEFGDIENGTNMNGGLKLRGRSIHGGGLLDSSSSDDLKSRTVDRAVTFLDGMGAYVGTLLRRYPQVRLGFAAYILLLHLWVAFVLWHFTHHAPSLPP